MDEVEGSGAAGDGGGQGNGSSEAPGGGERFSVGPVDQPLPLDGAGMTFAPAFGPSFDVPMPSIPAPGRPKKRQRALIVTVAALLMIAAGVGGILATSGGSSAPGSGMSAADFVVTSTQNTVAQRTADMDITGSVSVQGTTVPISGSGQIDFTTTQVSASLDLTADQRTVSEKELLSDGQAYMNISIDGQGMSGLSGGAQWIEIPLPQQSASSIGGADVDPLSAIKMMEQRGAAVVPLGPSDIDGDTVSGYSVTPSQSEIEGALQKEVQAGQLPASSLSTRLNEAKALGTFNVDIWIDGNDLLRREAVTIGGGTSGATADVAMTFQDYGTPVSIQTPAPGSVVSLSQFMNDVKSQESGSTT
jgi:hypothetical protein